MAHRPTLKIGDVVRLSKPGRKAYGKMYGIRNRTMIVAGFSGDTSEGHTVIVCNLPETDSSRGRKCHIKRRHLWATGYNVSDGKSQLKMTSGTRTSSGGGFSSTTPQSKPKSSSRSCVCPTASLMAFGCKCGGV